MEVIGVLSSWATKETNSLLARLAAFTSAYSRALVMATEAWSSNRLTKSTCSLLKASGFVLSRLTSPTTFRSIYGGQRKLSGSDREVASQIEPQLPASDPLISPDWI